MYFDQFEQTDQTFRIVVDPSVNLPPVDRKREKQSAAPETRYTSISLKDLAKRSPAALDAILDEVYAAYEQCFPDPNERSPRYAFERDLMDPSGRYDIVTFWDGGEIIGARHINILPFGAGRFAVDEYLWVAPEQRLAGHGSGLIKLTEDYLRAQQVEVVFAEINDPMLMTEDEYARDCAAGVDPELRLRFWNKLGYQALDMPYIQPSIEGAPPTTYLLLACKFLNREQTPKDLPVKYVLDALKQYHDSFGTDAVSDPLVVSMRARLENFPKIRLVPLTQPREFVQEREELF